MKSALGKGLDALISGDTLATVDAAVEKGKPITAIPISGIRANPKQPRRAYDETALQQLADSIRQHGVLQPILIAPASDGNYEIIAGERRWRAAQRAGLTHIPAVIKSAGESERFQMALIENIQREDLNALEQAQGFMRLMTEFHMTQEAIAGVLKKDRAVIANTLRLLNLPEHVQSALKEGKISASHGRTLAALEDPTAQLALFNRIIEENLSVRSVEEIVRDHKKILVRGHTRGTSEAVKSPDVRTIEEELQRALARKVELQIPPSKEGAGSFKKGWMKLEFYSLDDLDHLIAQLKRAAAQPSIS